MSINHFLNNEVPDIANKLEKMNQEFFFSKKTIGIAGKESIKNILHLIRSAVFPGVYEKMPIEEINANILIGNNIRIASLELNKILQKIFLTFCNDTEKAKKCYYKDCEDKALSITKDLINELPNIRLSLQKDIDAAYLGDPAATSREEILLSYPSIEAISTYRIANFLYNKDVPLIPRVMSEYAHKQTGIDINAGASIGDGFFIDHGTGVVIGETCTIGNGVKIYQGVTLGAKSFPLDKNGNPIKGIKRHPDIGDNVVIYAGATILGGDTFIGANSIIGSNVWLTSSVPKDSTVFASTTAPTIK